MKKMNKQKERKGGREGEREIGGRKREREMGGGGGGLEGGGQSCCLNKIFPCTSEINNAFKNV